jgi:hypothetical protein
LFASFESPKQIACRQPCVGKKAGTTGGPCVLGPLRRERFEMDVVDTTLNAQTSRRSAQVLRGCVRDAQTFWGAAR